MINSNFGDYTLALFSAGTANGGDLRLTPETGATAAKYAMSTQTATLEDVTAVAAPKDLASSLRPAESTKMEGIYTNPSTQATTSVAPAYTGPSYTERANGDLLGQVMADLHAIRSNQFAELKESFDTLVEDAIGRELSDGEDAFDHWSAISNMNTDRSGALLGGAVNKFTSRLWTAIEAGGGQTTVGSHPIMFRTDLDREEREGLIIEDRVNGRVNSQIRAIQWAISKANEMSGPSEGTLPSLSDDEIEVLRGSLLAKTQSQLESGELVIDIADDHWPDK